jgi:hypothetical protein
MRSKVLRFLTFGILTLLLLLAAPVIARIGSMQTLRSWVSTPGALGINRPLTFSFQKHVAYVDVFS